MASFKSPALNSFASLTAALSRIPSQNRDTLQELSHDASDLITAADALHVYEIEGEPDDLVFVTVQVEWLKNHPREDHRGTKFPAGAVFLASTRNRSFGRVVEQLEHITGEKPQHHLNGHVVLFGTFAVVRTSDSTAKDTSLDAVKTATKNITITLSQLSKTTITSRYVWHHGPHLRPLTHFISSTTPSIRNNLLALTISASISSLPSSSTPDPHTNTTTDWRTLETYARRLRLPIILLDPTTIPCHYTYLNHVLKNLGELVPALFPASVYTENVNHYLDLAHVLVYRVVAAAARRHSAAVASKVDAAIPPHHEGVWPRACVSARAYPRERCRMKRALPAMKQLAWYTDMGMMPLGSARASSAAGVARVLLGPGRATDAVMCVPVEIAFRGGAFRVSSAGTFCVYTLDRTKESGRAEALFHAQVAEAVVGGVEGFVKGFYERRKNQWGYQPEGLGQVPDGVAVMWGEVYQGLIKQLRGVAQGEAGKGWSEEEKRDVQSVVKALGTGSFTTAVVGVLRKRARKGKSNGCWISG
ncbi:hypothetical protein BU16DRAFT_542507 [Lophium mytilinum]|uniref:Uncharacterized protein n=1 Tax=Lophium mytilinum TaxID=390894 RepID=A0A6A6QIV0_9PEZI|nr:hypothetical protein BU16DRAFT_542507 [Lophium mytilinum]